MLRTSIILLGSTAMLLSAGLIPETYRNKAVAQTQGQAPAPLPTVDLPPELNRVLRDYEKHWKANDGAALGDLFTDDGFINRGGWIRGKDAIRAAYARSGGDLRLRAVGYATGDTVGYIVGGYRYGDTTTDGGKFVLGLRRAPRGDWKIAVDLDAANRQ